MKKTSRRSLTDDVDVEIQLMWPQAWARDEGEGSIHDHRQGHRRLQWLRLFFNQRMNGYEVKGIDSILISAINECEEKNRSRLLSNVGTTGGTMEIRGIDDRIQHELSKSTNDEVKVISTQDRQLSLWIGGSIFSSLEQFKHISISCYDYKESGPSVSLQKCV